MKKAFIFLSLTVATLGVGIGTYVFFFNNVQDQPAQESNIEATVEEKCGTKLKSLYGNGGVTANMLNQCAVAYRIVANSKVDGESEAQEFCNKLSNNVRSACFQGRTLAIDAQKAAAQREASKDSSSGSSGSSGSSKSGGSSGSGSGSSGSSSPSPSPSSTSNQASQNTGNAAPKVAAKTGPEIDKVVDPKNSTECRNGEGVKLGTGGLGTTCVGDSSTNPIIALIKIISRFAIGLLGLIFVFMVVLAGFQYTISRGNPDETKAAKKRLEHAVTGVILLAIMYAMLSLLGVFN